MRVSIVHVGVVRKNDKKILLIIAVVFLIMIITSILGIKPAVKSGSLDNISLPQGFKIDVFADALDDKNT